MMQSQSHWDDLAHSTILLPGVKWPHLISLNNGCVILLDYDFVQVSLNINVQDMPSLPNKFPVCFWSLSVGVSEKTKDQSLCSMVKVNLLQIRLALTRVDATFSPPYPGIQLWYRYEARVRL